MNKYTISLILLIVTVLGFLTGFYLYSFKRIKNVNDNNMELSELIEDECTYISENKNNYINVNTNVKKISPNCNIIFKIFYKTCGHLTEKKEIIKSSEVNLTEEEFKEKFKEWEVQRFTETEIVVYKEVDGFCNEHYVIKEKDGYIAIFSLDENNHEELEEKTNISTEYLEEEDLKKIREGIFVYSKKELNKVIEDFE